MGFNAQILSDEDWAQLNAAYGKHGSGPEF